MLWRMASVHGCRVYSRYECRPVSSVKVRSEKNGVGETARSKRMNSAFLRRRSMAANWR